MQRSEPSIVKRPRPLLSAWAVYYVAIVIFCAMFSWRQSSMPKPMGMKSYLCASTVTESANSMPLNSRFCAFCETDAATFPGGGHVEPDAVLLRQGGHRCDVVERYRLSRASKGDNGQYLPVSFACSTRAPHA